MDLLVAMSLYVHDISVPVEYVTQIMERICKTFKVSSCSSNFMTVNMYSYENYKILEPVAISKKKVLFSLCG